MYAVMGITGKVGGALASTLLESGAGVRAVVRDAAKARAWTNRGSWTNGGCEIAQATAEDATALTRAFQDVEGVFVMLPPVFDPQPGFPEAKAAIAAISQALRAAAPARIVCLSTIGADARQPNLLNQLGLLEEALQSLPTPITCLRPCWFMDNAAFDIASARATGHIDSFLQPLDKPYPMVAARDVGSLAAQLMQETWNGHRIIELEGSRHLTPNDIAESFSAALRAPVVARAIPHRDWESLFRAQGMQNPTPRMQMLEGFNAGWIRFSDDDSQRRKGRTTIDQVMAGLVGQRSTS